MITYRSPHVNKISITVNTIVRQLVLFVSSCRKFPPQFPQQRHKPKQQKQIRNEIANDPPKIVRAMMPAHQLASCVLKI